MMSSCLSNFSKLQICGKRRRWMLCKAQMCWRLPFFVAVVIVKHLLGVMLPLAVAPLLWDLFRGAVLLQNHVVLCIPVETAQHPVARGHLILVSS